MKKLNFTFSTKLTFDNYVHDHSIALRCIPLENEVQHIVNCELTVTPLLSTQQTVDAFGNNVTTGYLKKEHRFLDFDLNGTAEIDSSKHRTDYMPCYRYQSKLTKPGEELAGFYKKVSESIDSSDVEYRANQFAKAVNEEMKYEKFSTDIGFTAEDAFKQRKGVCQDFTHVLLSLLRQDDIPCRYIAGLASCDGETHAWAEFWNGEYWIGIDPTNGCPADDNYLVLSQGRDFSDCAIDRGVMMGMYTRQMQLVSSNLTEQY